MKFNKKKIACFALAGALVIPGVIGLAGCEKAHTHAFNSDPFYEVVTEGETKIARSWRECSCGAEDAHKKVDNAVIVTPETAQEYLDDKHGEINNKTIVFDKGTYSTELVIRPSKYDAAAYEYLGMGDNFYVLGENIEDLTTLAKSSAVYHYLRSVSNLTFAGTEDAIFTAPITFSSRYYYKNTLGNPTVGIYDAVREIWCNETTNCGYMNHLAMENLKFTRLNFEGPDGIIECYTEQQITDSHINNISVNNCSFITEQPNSSSMAAFRMTGEELVYKNVEFRNNFVDGHFQGTYVINTTNAIYENNVIQNTKHNAFALQSQGGNYFTGDLIVRNNIIKNCLDGVSKDETDPEVWKTQGERAMRIGCGKNATIIISGNKFYNCYEQIAATVSATPLQNCTYSIINNTYNDVKIPNLEGNKQTFIITHTSVTEANVSN